MLADAHIYTLVKGHRLAEQDIAHTLSNSSPLCISSSDNDGLLIDTYSIYP